jgi:hypothetical protein
MLILWGEYSYIGRALGIRVNLPACVNKSVRTGSACEPSQADKGGEQTRGYSHHLSTAGDTLEK